MIARISGEVAERGDNYLLVSVGGIHYKVLIPMTVMQRVCENVPEGKTVTLITYHYYQVEPTKSTPVLIGFLNEVEKEFFESFITVSGIGPRAALRALSEPISLIAKAIEEEDIDFLKSLPGIGQQRAKEIIAKLQHKVGKFGLIQDAKVTPVGAGIKGIEEDALAVLMQLEYKKTEASTMIKMALAKSPGIETTEELLNEVYKQKKLK
ncbi:MAG: Holliday junction branch migration protein RuvA [Candidatus Omnitrophota bacterium]